jgi:hypothetical protein
MDGEQATIFLNSSALLSPNSPSIVVFPQFVVNGDAIITGNLTVQGTTSQHYEVLHDNSLEGTGTATNPLALKEDYANAIECFTFHKNGENSYLSTDDYPFEINTELSVSEDATFDKYVMLKSVAPDGGQTASIWSDKWYPDDINDGGGRLCFDAGGAPVAEFRNNGNDAPSTVLHGYLEVANVIAEHLTLNSQEIGNWTDIKFDTLNLDEEPISSWSEIPTTYHTFDNGLTVSPGQTSTLNNQPIGSWADVMSYITSAEIVKGALPQLRGAGSDPTS